MAPLHRQQVYKALGIKSEKIPPDMSGEYPDTYIPSTLGYARWHGTVVVTPANSRKHRIFLKCECGRLIPFGRIAQHKKGKDHA